MLKKKTKGTLTEEELREFTRQIRDFQMFDMHKEMTPELKNIVKSLTCAKHKFMYCPKCKNFDDDDFDPMENIQKFMQYVKNEKKKMKKIKKQREAEKLGKPSEPKNAK